VNGTPPSVPLIVPLGPETATAWIGSDLPLAQLTVPVSACPPPTDYECSRSLPPSEPAALEMLTN